MSDQNNINDTQPLGTEPAVPKPMRETQSVPLRKETVRVTLKSTPAGAKRPAAPTPPAARPPAARPPMPSGAPAPAAMQKDTAPQPSAAPAPSPSSSDIPDVTSAVPLKQETMRVTLKAEPPKAAAPAPAPAAAAPAPAAAPPVAAKTATEQQPTVALATESLPKATVQLQQTQQLNQPAVGAPGTATFKTSVEEEVATKDNTTLITVLSIVAFVFALILLFVQFQRAGIWCDGAYGSVFSM